MGALASPFDEPSVEASADAEFSAEAFAEVFGDGWAEASVVVAAEPLDVGFDCEAHPICEAQPAAQAMAKNAEIDARELAASG